LYQQLPRAYDDSHRTIPRSSQTSASGTHLANARACDVRLRSSE
jgi:hypothetical protein